MGESQIPGDLRQFILINCPSVPHLEALLLLRRDPQRAWNAASMAKSLYIDERSAADVLRDLGASGLAAVDEGAACYHYAPASPVASRLVERLAELYSRALVAVTNLIHARSAQLFADAFKFRKD